MSVKLADIHPDVTEPYKLKHPEARTSSPLFPGYEAALL